MEYMKPKVVVGMISYNDKKYLEHNLPDLMAQDYENLEVMVCNNQPGNGITEWIEKEFPKVRVVDAGGNVGFGRAHNYMIELAAESGAEDKGAEFYLCFNSDMTIGADYVSKMVEAFGEENEEAEGRIGCVTGKLISWSNFPEDPSKIEQPKIDTVGLSAFVKGIGAGLIVDRGQGEVDKGQYEKKEEVFGASGASPMYRIEALKDVAHSVGEFFDKNFFMYKEDVDLAFRLRWAGWKTIYTPEAVAWHDRTAADTEGIWAKIKAKRSAPEYIKKNSFINQLIVIKKFWSKDFSLGVKVKTWVFLVKYFLNLLVFNTGTLKYLKDYLKIARETGEKAQRMPRRVSASEMEQWFGK